MSAFGGKADIRTGGGSLERLMRLSIWISLCGRNPIWEIDAKVLPLKPPFSDSLGKKYF